MINIALSKGRLADRTIELLEKAGYDCSAVRDPGRKLIFRSDDDSLQFIYAKPSDVPTYVKYGAADIGVVGKDTLLEESPDLYEVLDLGFGACRVCVCGLTELRDEWAKIPNKRIGTKYPNIAREHFEITRREAVEIIKLNGSVELAPIIGLSDVIVDIVESGKTLEENGLEVYETITACSARMVVNRVSMKMKADAVEDMIHRCRAVLKAKRDA